MAGCQSGYQRAHALPLGMRATPMAGKERMRLGGLLAATAPSSAVGPGDLLEATIATGMAGEEPMVHQTRVAADGSIDTPLIGRVAVAGIEPSQAADQIASAAVARGIYVRPQVSVVVAEQATHQITVLGAVDEPGVQDLPRSGCDVLTAVAAAGGFTDEAGTVVEVLRSSSLPIAATTPGGDGSEVQQVSFDAPALPGGTAAAESIDLSDPSKLPPGQLALNDRDVIVVRPREKRVIHVTGLVEAPDQFELLEDHDFRILDAIAMAGGVTTPIADKVLIVRQMEGAPEPVVIQASVSRAKKDGSENLILQAGDLVSVESTAATVALSTFQNLFRITMGVGGNLSLF
ncbi:Polysaccharide biosynthesis/export protein [Planctomycetes bacterium MalM25]|nr:Polysaccharide biosynthesis/export protein [Planctomycetes bacterium MalM25]